MKLMSLIWILLAGIVPGVALAQNQPATYLDSEISNKAIQAIEIFKNDDRSQSKFSELVLSLRPLLLPGVEGIYLPDELASELETLSEYGQLRINPANSVILTGTYHWEGRTHYSNGKPISDSDSYREKVPNYRIDTSAAHKRWSWFPNDPDRRAKGFQAAMSTVVEMPGFSIAPDDLRSLGSVTAEIFRNFQLEPRTQNTLAGESFPNLDRFFGRYYGSSALFEISKNQTFLTAKLKTKTKEIWADGYEDSVKNIKLFEGEQSPAAQVPLAQPIGIFEKMCRYLMGESW